jgi:hypothetical protein
MSPLFEAAIEATEESIYNSLFRACDMRGRGHSVKALPLKETRKRPLPTVWTRHWVQVMLRCGHIKSCPLGGVAVEKGANDAAGISLQRADAPASRSQIPCGLLANLRRA